MGILKGRKAAQETAGVRSKSRKKTIETAVHTWTHPAGRTITVVNVCHFGPSEYYKQLGKIIGRLEEGGAAVQYESSVGPHDPFARARNDAERTALTSLRAGGGPGTRRAEALGWVGQGQGLPVRAGWTWADGDPLQLVRTIGAANIPKPRELPNIVDRARKLSPWQARMYLWSQLLALEVQMEGRIPQRPWGSAAAKFVNLVIVESRSLAAGAAAMATDDDLVLIWGLSHAPRLGEIMRNNGFELTNTEWVTLVNWKVERPLIWGRIVAGPPESGGPEQDCLAV